MLSILSGITKLWSLPVIKLSLVVVLTMSVYVYVSILDSQIEQQLLELERQDIELANNRITIATLTESISAANNATDEALAELVRVDKLAVNRAKKRVKRKRKEKPWSISKVCCGFQKLQEYSRSMTPIKPGWRTDPASAKNQRVAMQCNIG